LYFVNQQSIYRQEAGVVEKVCKNLTEVVGMKQGEILAGDAWMKPFSIRQ
jgi:hypothetical protein